MALKSGKSSTEWWTIVGVIALAVAKQLDIIPQDATAETVSSLTSSEALPYIIDKIVNLAQGNASLLIAGGLAWAYLKRRSGLKVKQAKE